MVSYLQVNNLKMTMGLMLLFSAGSDFSHAQQIALVPTAEAKLPRQSDSVFGLNSNASGVRPGKLMLCGGGVLPDSILDTFFDCGDAHQGSLVVIPTASSMSDRGDFTRWIQFWSRHSWQKVNVLHAQDRKQAETDSFVDVLRQATAVWIAGGDQCRLADRYVGTLVEKELQNVVRRGGVVGGTSAGTAITTKVMISGGYTQPKLQAGIDLLPNAIVDQHFSQRTRYKRLANAVAVYPDRVGVGIDEGTALLLSEKQAQVVGKGSVYVYRDPRKPESVEGGDSQTTFETRKYSAGQMWYEEPLAFPTE